MDKELKAKWVAALRSGDYQQLHDGVLYDRAKHRYCCLGVFAQVSCLMLSNDGKPLMSGHLQNHYDVVELDMQRTLWRMNDGYGYDRPKTFAEIADYIEDTL